MTTIREALEQGTRALCDEDSRSARLDAQVLLSHVLGVERVTLYAYPERTITPEQQWQFLSLIERRQKHEPVAYVVGHKEFYGLDFLVDRRVLIPRPETELLVESALATIRHKLANGHIPLVADIGTGSGAIPVTLAVEEPRLPYLYATDISSDALVVARLNCQHHHVESRVRLLRGDLLAPLPEPVDVLTANLPYVATEEQEDLAPDVMAYEPHHALFSGPQGLDLLLRLLREMNKAGALKASAVVLLEIGYQQRKILVDQIQNVLPHATVKVMQDYAGWDRLLKIVV